MARFFRGLANNRWMDWRASSIIVACGFWSSTSDMNPLSFSCNVQAATLPPPGPNSPFPSSSQTIAIGAAGAWWVWENLISSWHTEEIAFHWHGVDMPHRSLEQTPATDTSGQSDTQRTTFAVDRPESQVLKDPSEFFHFLVKSVYSEAIKNENMSKYLESYFPLISVKLDPNSNATYLINNDDSCKYVLDTVANLNKSDGLDKMPCFNVTWMSNNGHNADYNSLKGRLSTQETLQGNGTRIILIGETGTGKSSLANSLLAAPHDEGMFSVGHSSYSCTQDVVQHSGFMAGKTQGLNTLLSVVDTPGMNDFDHTNNCFFSTIVNFLKKSKFGVNMFVLTLNIENPRLTASEKSMIHTLNRLFGPEFKNHLLIVFTKCDKLGGGYKSNLDSIKQEYRERIGQILELGDEDRNGTTYEFNLEVMDVSCTDLDNTRVIEIIDKATSLDKFDNDHIRTLAELTYEDMEAKYEAMLEEAKEDKKLFKEALDKLSIKSEKQEEKLALYESIIKENEKQLKQYKRVHSIKHRAWSY